MELVNEENIDELIQAQSHIWNHTFNFIKSMALKSAIQLAIPDTINRHGKPMTLSELALALGVHPTKTHHLYRLMRLLIHSGFFKYTQTHSGQQGYTLTLASRLLLKENNLFDLSPFISMHLEPVLLEPFNHLTAFLQNDDPSAFKTAFGEQAWSYGEQDLGVASVFYEAMASDSLMMGRVVMVKCKNVFEGLKSLVDVGGGTGNMAKAIAETFPSLNCTVLDLPQAVSELKGSNNLSFLGGDMFQSVPPADAILLKWILHDWGDEDCIKILKNCKEAIPRNGKVIIIDIVMGNHENWTETQLLYDMEMMACVSGKERNEKEWAKLFLDSGFTTYKIHNVLGPRALIEVYPFKPNRTELVSSL
ncbi:trans-resveratrol di-O-methyltransferase-like [Mercurialis annua]|uniref:trans-resveratrol di-O-methyltransferase-like n=1 Tax=Mercurialis annua TaxID=3986 RepID=UPI00215E2774|nr:trans-resveratrol di-O-methyltransferase-like [Mercurialis annua]